MKRSSRALAWILIGLVGVGVLANTARAQAVPSHITVVATDYTFQNDSLGIGITFQVNDPDLDSVYISGPFNHAVLAALIGKFMPPFTSPQKITNWYDVSAVTEGQTVAGTLSSRTFRGGCRSGTTSCGGSSTGPLSLPFSWIRPPDAVRPPPVPYVTAPEVSQILDSLRILVTPYISFDGLGDADSVQITHTTNELALVQTATAAPNVLTVFMITAPPMGVRYTGSYVAVAFRGCDSLPGCTATATSPAWSFNGEGPQPPNDFADWVTPNPPVLYNQPLAAAAMPASVGDCSSIGMRYITRPVASVGVRDTMRVHITAPGATGCTFYMPKTAATAPYLFRTYFDTFMVPDTTDTQVPSAPIIIATDTLGP